MNMMKFSGSSFVIVYSIFHIIAGERRSYNYTFCKRCYCHPVQNGSQNYFNADCSNLNLIHILDVPNDVHDVDFSHNRIQIIPEGHFRNNTALQRLKLSYNQISYLKDGSFTGLSSMNFLTVDNNNINFVSKFSFSNITMLQHLNIKKNSVNMLDIDISFPPSLRTLKMDLQGIGNSFKPKGLDKLEYFDVSGINGNCNITTVTSEIFQFGKALQHLDISSCKINYIHEGTFSIMSDLKLIDISFNPCLKFDGLGNVTRDLPTTSIKVLKANKIHKTFELSTIIKIAHIESLKLTNLTEIHLDSNRIQLFEQGALEMLPHTTRAISLVDNMFSYGGYLYDSLVLPIEFVNLTSLFSTHKIRSEENCVRVNTNSPVLLEEEKPKNKVGNFLGNFLFKYSLIVFPIPRHLKKLIYRNCVLKYEIPEMTVSVNSLEYIDASFNIFFSWIGPLLHLDKLTYLDMSNNLCSNVSKVFFQSCPNVTTLLIQNNLLGFVLPDDLNGEILHHIPKLERLNLAENRIPNLPTLFFKAQTHLRILSLAGNLLDGVTFQISHMTNLSFIDLSNNRISTLDKGPRDQLDSIKNISIDLSDNPLRCTCDTIAFIEWLASSSVKFHHLKKYACFFSDGKKKTLHNPKRVYEHLKKECSHYTILIISVVSVLICFIFVLIWGLVYRHRWKLRYMFYMVKSKYSKANKSTLEREYQYDAFVSYEDKDRFFVHDKLLKKLENEAGLKLCLHKRDFIVGNDIQENITSCIHNSRKVIVILSYNYLDSYWCMFEYNMARMESIYSRNKDNILYLVFLEQVSSKDLPLMILELVQSQSYIEYPNDEYGDTVFWENLIHALP